MSATAVISDSEIGLVRSDARRRPWPVGLWIVIFLSPLPQLMLHFRRLWLYEHYQYFPFVIAAFAYFTWRRWPRGTYSGGDMPKTERFLLFTALTLLAVSTIVWAPWLGAVATIFMIGAAMVHFGGKQAVASLTSVWLLLWLLIPIPFGLDVAMVFELQSIASDGASYLLDALGVNHYLAGHVLEIPGHRFLVEEACSGIHSLFALMAFAAMLMIALQRPWLHAAILLMSTVVWAMAMNIVRVSTVVAAYIGLDLDLATDWKHETLGLLLNGIGILMLLCTDQLVLFFWERPAPAVDEDPFPDDDEVPQSARQPGMDSNERTGSGVVRRADQLRPRHRVSAVLVTLLFAVLGMGQISALCLKVDSWLLVGEVSERLHGAFERDSLAAQFGNWKQVGFERNSRPLTNHLGANYAAWDYETAGAAAKVYTNYPCLGWYPLHTCYKAQGWQIQSLEMTPISLPDGTTAEIWCLEVTQPSVKMHVRFCHIDDFGRPVRPKTNWLPTSWLDVLQHDVGSPWRLVGRNKTTYQIVMQVTPSDPSWNTSPELLTQEFAQIQSQVSQTIRSHMRDND